MVIKKFLFQMIIKKLLFQLMIKKMRNNKQFRKIMIGIEIINNFYFIFYKIFLLVIILNWK